VIDHGRGAVSLFRWLPGLQAVRSYRREWLPSDIVAGVVLTTLLVPQGMTYAELVQRLRSSWTAGLGVD